MGRGASHAQAASAAPLRAPAEDATYVAPGSPLDRTALRRLLVAADPSSGAREQHVVTLMREGGSAHAVGEHYWDEALPEALAFARYHDSVDQGPAWVVSGRGRRVRVRDSAGTLLYDGPYIHSA